MTRGEYERKQGRVTKSKGRLGLGNTFFLARKRKRERERERERDCTEHIPTRAHPGSQESGAKLESEPTPPPESGDISGVREQW